MEKKKRGRPPKTPKPSSSDAPLSGVISPERGVFQPTNPGEARSQLLELKLAQARLLSEKVELMDGLPHLYAQKMYPWQREFFESHNKNNFLCAANQIGKSSIQIRKAIHWATAVDLWVKLWRKQPRQFWYMYPSAPLATAEFEQKWVKDFLPRGSYKDHEQYGWKAVYAGSFIKEVKFNSGVSIYFHTYTQNAQHIQAATLDAIFTDEELPEDIYDELNFRRMATDGYFHMAFTATMGQHLWKQTLEGVGAQEKFSGAFKKQVSMWDCLAFEDGTKSHWSPEKILKAIASCKSEAEVQRRIYGRFVLDSGLRYSGFVRGENFGGGGDIPSSWLWYGGADVGAGGDHNHPAAIIFVAVSPDFKKGRVVQGWRGNAEVTTASDVLDKFVEMRGEREFIGQFYDWHSKDFLTMAQRRGESFMPAEKSQEIGVQILNALFKNKMLSIDEKEELVPLVDELVSLQIDADKRSAKDDFIDALRYAVTRVSWDWSSVGLAAFNNRSQLVKPVERSAAQIELDDRRRLGAPRGEEGWSASMDVEDEIAAWQDLYDV